MGQRKRINKKKRSWNCKLSKIFYLKLLKKGKISCAQKIWTKCLRETKHLFEVRNRNNLLLNTLKALGPQVDLCRLRKGKRVLEAQIPFPIKKKRKIFLGFKWFLDQTSKTQLTRSKNLALAFSEMLEEKPNKSLKKKLWQNQAQKNIKFLRFRWL